MLCKVSALALFLLLGSFSGDKSSLVSRRLLKSFLITRLKATGKVQTSKLAEECHHLQSVQSDEVSFWMHSLI